MKGCDIRVGSLKNEFAFSFSRYNTLKECPRKFYLSYHGHWDGWNENSNQLAKDAYRLKQLTGMYMWAGNLVHNEIERTIKDVMDEQAVDYKASLKRMAQQSKREFAMSEIRAQNPSSPAKLFGLKEHEYKQEITSDFKARIWDRTQVCLATFFGLDILDRIRSVGRSSVLSVDDYATFPVKMDNGYEVKVYSVPDLAFREDDKVVIYDWKTGKEKSGYKDQIALYALFASRYWDVRIPDVEVNICYLLGGNNYRKVATQQWIQDTETKIKNQSTVLMSKLVGQDPDKNKALDIKQFPISKTDEPCMWCNFERICGVKEFRKTSRDPLSV
jgi:hypothetical protein